MNRRQFLKSTLAAGGAIAVSERLAAAVAQPAFATGGLHLAAFRFDVTPPIGHSLCGGWIKPVSAYDDPLEAIGYVLLGAGKPVVFCAVDWTGILNEAHLRWRTTLAEAAGTTPDRVALHCVHQHNAPFVCLDAGQRAEEQGDLPKVFEVDFLRRCLDRGRDAIVGALKRARPVTHIAQGEAVVMEVASNRRVSRDGGGKIKAMRGSASKDPTLVALPEGLIDPRLRTLAFYDRDTKIAAAHFYATHPMSYYGDGRVSSDFCGLARRRRQADEPGCTHLYFTGCAGDIAAGKYNNGTPEARVRLTQRIYDGMVASEATLRREEISRLKWRTHEIRPVPNPALGDVSLLEASVKKRGETVVSRMRPAFKVAFMNRCARKTPLVIGALHLNDAVSLYLPAEPFVEYQLRAQAIAGRSVPVAGYGDNGPWYIPTEAEFPAGGYEVEHAFAHPNTDAALMEGMRRVLG
jgi:hypothetical protein